MLEQAPAPSTNRQKMLDQLSPSTGESPTVAGEVCNLARPDAVLSGSSAIDRSRSSEPSLRVEVLESTAALLALADPWNRLWQRSEVMIPTARAEPVAHWVETFAPARMFRAVLVWSGDLLIGALPLVRQRLGRLVPVWAATINHWSPNGELLLDPAADQDAVAGALVAAVCGQPWPLVWLETVPWATRRWRRLCEAMTRLGAIVDIQPRYEIGRVSVTDAFEVYMAGRSRNLRRNVRKDFRRLAGEGRLRVALCDHLAAEEVEPALRRVFSLEDRGWKGAGGTSVLRNRGMFEFYCRQAEHFARQGRLRLAFLEHAGRPIAFELGWLAKGVYHSFKVGYDERYGRFGPGHLLRAGIVEADCGDPARHAIDFQGPITEALRSWATETYSIGRIAICPPGTAPRLLWAAIGGLRTGSRWLKRVSTLPQQARPVPLLSMVR